MEKAHFEEDSINLVELAMALLDKWIWIVLAMLVFGGAMGAYNKLFVKPTYRAEAEIYITNSDSILNLQDIQISAALTGDYASIMKSRTVLKKVIADQELDMNYSQLGSLVSISNPNDTHILRVNVTTGSPELSIRITNSLLKYGIDQIFRTVGNDEPAIIDYAEADAITVIKTSLVKHAMLGAILGAILVCGIVVLRFLMDNTIHNEEDVKALELPVLAEIPEYAEEGTKKGGKKAHV